MDSSFVSVENALKSPTSLKTRGNLICTKHAINVKCDECGKEFGAKRNLKCHKKVKHETFQKDRSKNSNTSVGEGNGNDRLL